MQTKVVTPVLPTRAAAAQVEPMVTASAPIELDASLLKHVSGGTSSAVASKSLVTTLSAPNQGW